MILIVRDRAKGTQWRIPAALYPFTASVGVQLAGLIILTRFEKELISGINAVPFVWSCVLIAGFVLLVASVFVVRGDSGPTKETVQLGSNVLLSIAGLGFILYIFLCICTKFG
jgi:hypothetical protein